MSVIAFISDLEISPMAARSVKDGESKFEASGMERASPASAP